MKVRWYFGLQLAFCWLVVGLAIKHVLPWWVAVVMAFLSCVTLEEGGKHGG